MVGGVQVVYMYIYIYHIHHIQDPEILYLIPSTHLPELSKMSKMSRMCKSSDSLFDSYCFPTKFCK